MKKMKKIFALLIAMVMVLGMSTSVFAGTIVVESGTQEDGRESQDVLKGETYNAYKILNYTSDADKENYSYFLTTAQYDAENENGLGKLLESVGFEFTASADGTQYYVSNTDEISDSVAADLYAIKDDIATVAIASDSATADADKEAVFSDLDTGYWFVTSSLGALCSLQSYDDEVLIVEKNQKISTPTKEASDTEFQVGDTINYTVTYTDVAGTNNELTIVDTMSDGLTYKADTLAVKINGTAATTGFTATPDTDTDGATLTIVFDADVIEDLDAGQTIEITYSAQVNNDASLDGTEMNTVVARTSNQETTPTTVTINSFNVTINKTDGTDALKGAQFEIYRDDEECAGDALKLRLLTEDELAALGTEEEPFEPAADTVYYQVDTSATNTTIDMTDASSAVIYGLDEDSTYYVLETIAPKGYNLKEEPTAVEDGAASIDVINQSGTVLPSTGGIGTTIFYIIGAILVVGAGVVLVTRRRMNVQ